MNHMVTCEHRRPVVDCHLAEDPNRLRSQKWKIAWGEDEDIIRTSLCNTFDGNPRAFVHDRIFEMTNTAGFGDMRVPSNNCDVVNVRSQC